MILLFTFGTAVGDGAADHHGDPRPGRRRSALITPARPRDRGPDRRPDARDDDRARRRDRLRAVHRHPPPAPARATGWSREESIARAARHLGRRRRLRRRHRGDRAALARVRRHPARQRARLLAPRSSSWSRSLARDHAAAGAARDRSATGSTRCAVPLGGTEHRRPPAARLGALGARRRPPTPGARPDRGGRDPRRARAAGARPAARPAGRTAQLPDATRPRARPTTGSTEGFGAGHQRPAPDRGRSSTRRPRPTRSSSTSSNAAGSSSSSSRPTQVEREQTPSSWSPRACRPTRRSSRPSSRSSSSAQPSRAAASPTSRSSSCSRPPPTRAWSTSRTRSARTTGVKSVSPAKVDKTGTAAVFTRDPDHRRRRP